mgnify:CR=1 FL=1|jgi:hypothetical protein|tara:strand:+ start:502 stop:723 length:222 start_codon:yes stop_codon:yes gene_type:complete
MDKQKWKSVTINIDDYHAARGVSYLKNRKLAGTLTKLINDYISNVADDNKIDFNKFKKEMIKKSKNGQYVRSN